MTPTTRQIGYVKPDGWCIGGTLFVDDSFPEPFNVRLETGKRVYAIEPVDSVAVRVEATGKVIDRDGFVRCRVTFIGDGEPDVVCKGKLLLKG